MKLNFTNLVRNWNINGVSFEVKTTSTGIFWGVFRDGQKITDFMNCQGSCASMLVRAELKKHGITNF